MKDDLFIKNGITIPGHELIITASRAGGPGGQHVNKASTRVTVRWQVTASSALSDDQKERIIKKLESKLTGDYELIVHASSSRSQQQNKKMALDNLAQMVRKALVVPKKRMKTQMPKAVKEKRLKEKAKRGLVKKLRRAKYDL